MSRDALRRVLEEEASAVQAQAARLSSAYDEAVAMFLACEGRIVTCGLGKSGHIAQKAAATFSSTGTPSLFVHAAEAVHGDLGMVTARDVVLAYTYSGETDEIVRLLPAVRSLGTRIVLMTGRPDSSAARQADLVLDVAVEREACPNNLAPTTSTTVMLAVSDALAVAVMEARGFGREDFARYHPAGALGRRLTLRVSDVMRQGDDLPVVAPETPVLDAMRTITQVGAGGACVVDANGALQGFISDGDLRRHFLNAATPLTARASEIMTPGPATLSPDLMAVEALEIFQNYPAKIGEMPVVDHGRLVGLLMLKDLLRTGIV